MTNILKTLSIQRFRDALLYDILFSGTCMHPGMSYFRRKPESIIFTIKYSG